MRSFSTFSPIGTQGANRTPDVGAKLLVPSVWVREPRLMVPRVPPLGRVRISGSTFLDSIYAAYVLNGANPINLVTGSKYSITGTVVQQPAFGNQSMRWASSGGNRISIDPLWNTSGSRANTYIIHAVVDSLSSNQTLLSSHNLDQNPRFLVRITTGGAVDVVINGAGSISTSANGVVQQQKPFCVGVVTKYDNVNTIRCGLICVDGVAVSLSTDTWGDAPTYVSNWNLGWDAWANSMVGNMFSAFHWNRTMATPMLQEATRDPYQFLIPA